MNRSQWLDVLRLLGLGWYVVTAIGGGTVAGWFLDRWADTRPLFTLIGLAVGLVAAFWGMYQMVAPLLKRDVKSKDNR